MKICNKVFLIVFWLCTGLWAQVLQLDQHNFEQSASLNVNWGFSPRQWLDPNSNTNPPCVIDARSAWDNQIVCQEKWNRHGFGSYSLKVILPKTHPNLALQIGDLGYASRIYANGQLLAQFGQPSTSADLEQMALHPALFMLPHNLGDTLNLVLHISNFQDTKGGIRGPIELGSAEHLTFKRESNLALNLFLFGTLFIMALYHFMLFAMYRKDKAQFAFGALCLLIALRVLVTSDRFILHLIPHLDYITLVRIEYLTFYLSVPCFMLFMDQLFKPFYPKWHFKAILITTLISSALTLVAPLHVFTHTLPWMQGLTLIAIGSTFFHFPRIFQSKKPGAYIFSAGIAVFFTFIVNDILYVHNIVHTGNYISYGLLFFVLSQSLALAKSFAQTRRQAEELAHSLQIANQSIARFVPSEFLASLGKSKLSDVKLGQHIRADMAVLFSDICQFTALSETMSTWDNFRFINSYLSRMNPIVQRNHGFVDKYIGDAIMALFSRSVEDSLIAGIEMHREIQSYNAERTKASYTPVHIGVGIHYGSVMLGIVGSEDRLQSTVVSDTVNVASRIEEMTREFGSQILISREAADRIPRFDLRFKHRILGEITLRGKSKMVQVLEILEGLNPEEALPYLQHKNDFEFAVIAYQNRNLSQAFKIFEEIAQNHPQDQACLEYMRKIQNEI